MKLLILLLTLTFGFTKCFQLIRHKKSSSSISITCALEDNYQFKYSFNYDGNKFSGTIDMPKNTYTHYRSKSKIIHYGKQYLDYTKEDPGFKYINKIKQCLKIDADKHGYSGAKLAAYIVTFAQSCVPYTKDPYYNGLDYPKYPIETLLEMGGDCEDKSILAATLLNSFGFESGLFLLPKHMIAAIYLPDFKGGTRIIHENKSYACIEATDVYKIGHLATEFIANGELFILHHSRNN